MLSFLIPDCVRAEVTLPSLFSDHMVLSKGPAVPVWGKASPGEEVTVSLAEATSMVRAGSDGRWMVRLDLNALGPGPYQMSVSGANQIAITDVLVGTVWLASGQSNMEHALKATLGAPAEIARSTNPLLREFKVDKKMKAQPADDCKGRWVIAGPQTSGNFSAVGYYFGKKLQSALEIPVGIINASWGGTFSELWISGEAIDEVESLKLGEAARQKLIAEFPAKQTAFSVSFGAWLKANNREDDREQDASVYTSDARNSNDWHTTSLPGPISTEPGVFWIRKEIVVPAEAADPSQDFKVMIGRFDGFEEVYWNGVKVSETTYQKFPGEGYSRYFPIPKSLVVAGRNTIALRIYAPAGSLALSIDPPAFKAGPVGLAGDWLTRSEYKFSPLAPSVMASVPKSPRQVTMISASSIFNGLINPLVPYGLTGVLWYQGESDTDRAWEYRTTLSLLIHDWRTKWGGRDLPFYICQLPSFGPKQSKPAESSWAELREAQAASQELPDTTLTVLVDLGEADDIHLREKKTIGDRLANQALAKQFGYDIVTSGPEYRSMKVGDGKIEIQFNHVEGGLSAHQLPSVFDVSTLRGEVAPLSPVSPESQLQGFSICGEDRKWVWADAKLEGSDSILVWSNQVPSPVAVRYGWADNATVNLFNGAGLPAAPFRTDSYPAPTQNHHFGAGT
jgi:sialate O-acetylesterase